VITASGVISLGMKQVSFDISGTGTQFHEFVYPRRCEMRYSMQHMVGRSWGTRALLVQLSTFPSFFGGQIFFATLLTSCGVAVHVQQLKALRVYGWESILSPAFLYNRLPTGAWTSLVLCLSRAVATT
jgi:hypothetical protein